MGNVRIYICNVVKILNFSYLFFFFFFFQAEDGIRDIGVTGVQTCALPISVSQEYQADPTLFWLVKLMDLAVVIPAAFIAGVGLLRRAPWATKLGFTLEIGRASCRERV